MSDQPHYERNTAVKSAVGKGGKGIPGKANVGKFAGSKGGFPSKQNLKEYFKKRKSNSQKSGLSFPVGRVLTRMRKTKLADRVSKVAGIYLTAVMEYMISEIVENAGNVVREHKKRFIFPRHVYLAIEDDHEMKKYLGNQVILPTVGRKIYTHPFLVQKADERVSSKNFQVVTKDLENIKGYTKGDKKKNNDESEGSEEEE